MSDAGQPEMIDDQPQAKPKGGGCGKILGFGCLAVILIVVLAGVWLYTSRHKLMAAGVEFVAEEVAEQQLQLPPEEVEAVMRPIRELATKIEAGELTESDIALIQQSVQEGNEGIAIALRGFELRYVENGNAVPADQKEAAALAVNRFANALLDERIPRSALKPLGEIVLTQSEEDGSEQLKQELTSQEILAVIDALAQANTEHAVADPYQPLDLEALMRTALEAVLPEESL